jgi:hypothetical protein
MRIVDVTPSGLADFLRSGREKAGEDLVVAQFGKVLDDTHVMLRHLTLPQAVDKLGLVLVGPDGIWHLELLHLASLVNNGGVWVHWDYTKQSVQPVPFSTIAEQARSRLAELQAFLGPAGFGARQAVVTASANVPHEFGVPGIDLLLFVEEIEEFVRDMLPRYAPSPPVAVDEAVNLLTHKPQAPEAEASASRLSVWLNQRYPRLGSLTGLQLVTLALLTLANCCVLTIFATFLFSGP